MAYSDKETYLFSATWSNPLIFNHLIPLHRCEKSLKDVGVRETPDRSNLTSFWQYMPM